MLNLVVLNLVVASHAAALAASSSRKVASTVLQKCFGPQAVFADRALNSVIEKQPVALPPAEVAHATELVYGVLRHKASLDYQLEKLTSKKLTKKTELPTLVALRIGAYELLHLQGTPDYAAVNEAVSLVGKAQWKRKFCNGVLRNLARNRDTLPAPSEDASLSPLAALATETSTPEWLLRELGEDSGLLPTFDDVAAWARATQERPEMALRINRCRAQRGELVQALEAREIAVERGGVYDDLSETLVLASGGGKVTKLPGFSEGLWTVQDLGAQCVARLAAPSKGQTVLDVCSAPGGKATHLCELIGDEGRVVAVEVHPRKSRLIEEAGQRLQLSSIEVHVADASDRQALADVCPAGGADCVVLDAPCSGSGTLRRNPEHRHRDVERPTSKLAGLCELQDQLLASVAAQVKVGGTLTYSVCSPLLAETDERLAAFLETAAGASFRVEPIEEGHELSPFVADSALLGPNACIRTWTHQHAADSHFAARLRRIAA